MKRMNTGKRIKTTGNYQLILFIFIISCEQQQVTWHNFSVSNQSSYDILLQYSTIDSAEVSEIVKTGEVREIIGYTEDKIQDKLSQIEIQNVIYYINATVGDSLQYEQNPINLSNWRIRKQSTVPDDGIMTFDYWLGLYDSMFVKIR